MLLMVQIRLKFHICQRTNSERKKMSFEKSLLVILSEFWRDHLGCFLLQKLLADGRKGIWAFQYP